jgi:putative ABC transport system substrate-binding protein
MDRRTFVGSLAGCLIVVPLAARAQTQPMPGIGYLSGWSRDEAAHLLTAFRQGLSEAGYVEGRNVAIEFRWAEGQYDRLPAQAADLVRRQVAVIVAVGSPRSVRAAKAATSTIPIVFNTGGDPVAMGLVASLGRPGGNTTGVSTLTIELMAKRFELVHELMPKATIIALIVNPGGPAAESDVNAAQQQARSFGQQLHLLKAGTEQEIDAAFATLASVRPSVLVIGTDPVFNARREQFVALAARHAVPAIYEGREAVAAGGLISYGPSLPDAHRQVGIYTGRILKGAKPADLPVLRPTKFELVINMKTAKALGITIPQALLVRADEVIQ